MPLSDEDFKAAEADDSFKTIEIRDFVDYKVKEPREAPDLMVALEESLRRAKEGQRRDGKDGLTQLSKHELYEMAKSRDIAGRSDMTKEELLEALGEAA